jgi:predicted amidophosphoribosyltransferase
MDEMVEVPLHAVAHSRAGDKGNRANLSLIPYDPALYPLLAEQVTEARVLALFQHRGATRCTRYDLPRLASFNFVVDDVLATGGTAAAALTLIERLGGEVVGSAFLLELGLLDGRSRLPGRRVHSVLSV